MGTTAPARRMRPTFPDVDPCVPSHSQRNASCAHQAHIGIVASVPNSVPKRGPMAIIRHPTPTKVAIKNGPEIVNFRPVL